MNLFSVQSLISNGTLDLEASAVSEIDGQLRIGEHIPLVVTVDCSFKQEPSLEVFDAEGQILGVLCQLSCYENIDLPALSEWEFAAYLRLVDEDAFDLPASRLGSCFVVDTNRYLDYNQKYKESAPIWGGFVHLSPPDQGLPLRTQNSIQAYPDILIPTRFHRNALTRAVHAAHPFDRFLKLYHQLELAFEWSLIEDIRNLGNELEGVGRLLAEYNQKDFQRLKQLIQRYCHNANTVAQTLRLASTYEADCSRIFQDHSKDGNPLRHKFDRFIEFLHIGPSLETAKRKKLASDIKSYEKLILDVAAYWIYRIRSSIAHSRFGEYMLTDDNSNLVVGFVEPLLKEVLCQVLSNTSFQNSP